MVHRISAWPRVEDMSIGKTRERLKESAASDRSEAGDFVQRWLATQWGGWVREVQTSGRAQTPGLVVQRVRHLTACKSISQVCPLPR